jgi:hypothetical protein
LRIFGPLPGKKKKNFRVRLHAYRKADKYVCRARVRSLSGTTFVIIFLFFIRSRTAREKQTDAKMFWGRWGVEKKGVAEAGAGHRVEKGVRSRSVMFPERRESISEHLPSPEERSVAAGPHPRHP